MENRLSEIEFTYLRYIVACVEGNALTWNAISPDNLKAKITNELDAELRYYENGEKPVVIDIRFKYSFKDQNHGNYQKICSLELKKSIKSISSSSGLKDYSK